MTRSSEAKQGIFEYAQKASRRYWGKLARPLRVSNWRMPIAKLVLPDDEHRAAPVSTLDHYANQETALFKFNLEALYSVSPKSVQRFWDERHAQTKR